MSSPQPSWLLRDWQPLIGMYLLQAQQAHGIYFCFKCTLYFERLQLEVQKSKARIQVLKKERFGVLRIQSWNRRAFQPSPLKAQPFADKFDAENEKCPQDWRWAWLGPRQQGEDHCKEGGQRDQAEPVGSIWHWGIGDRQQFTRESTFRESETS